MKIIGLDKWTGSYSEIGQTNPLRWQNLRPLADGAYEVVSHKWKCKDFMNEVVTSFHTGRDFSIYGFSVEHKKFFSPDQLTLPILLHNILPGWMSNMEVVNEYLLDQGYPAVDILEVDGKVVVELPTIYLANTLFMSQVTLFIRLANTETVYQTLQEMCNDKLNKQDQPNLDACLKKPLKDFPEKLYDYLWYYNDERNLKRDVGTDVTIQTSLMHNCGVVNWGGF
jgi:hypothetical protein